MEEFKQLVEIFWRRRSELKKLMMVAAMLAVVLAVAVPALAQVQQVPVETFVSGTNTNNGGAVTSGGSNSNTCAAQQVFNNSGGLLSQDQQQQYDSTSGPAGVGFGGSVFTNNPAQVVPCSTTVQQAASSSSGSM